MRGLIDVADSLIAGPTLEPLDLEEVKKALRFTPTTEDTLLDVWISAARQFFEEQTGRQTLTATRERWLSGFPIGGIVELPYPPLQAVLSVTYDDGTGTHQTLATDQYHVSAPVGPTCGRGCLTLVSGASWPTVSSSYPQAVRIQYRAGYGDAPGDVPELVKGALYFLIGHFHRFRSEGTEAAITKVPLGAEMILRAFRYSALPTLGPPRVWSETTWPA